LKSAKNALTLDRLKEILSYSPVTGLFTYAISRPKCRIGAEAGSVDSRGHVRIGIDGHYHAAHRLAYLWMVGEWPIEDIWHKNLIGTDNRWKNLVQSNRKEADWESVQSKKELTIISNRLGPHLSDVLNHSVKLLKVLKVANIMDEAEIDRCIKALRKAKKGL